MIFYFILSYVLKGAKFDFALSSEGEFQCFECTRDEKSIEFWCFITIPLFDVATIDIWSAYNQLYAIKFSGKFCFRKILFD